MQQYEIDWYRDLLARYVNAEHLSLEDLHRLNFLRNRYVVEIGEPLPVLSAETVEYIRAEVK